MLTFITGILPSAVARLVSRAKPNRIRLGLLLASSLFVTNATVAGEPEPSPATVIATINGIPLRLKAFGFFLKDARSEVIGEISQRPDANLTHQDFWDRKVDGIAAAELVKRKALAQATEYYAMLAKGVELGLAKPDDDPLTLADISELRRNKTMYGPELLSEAMIVSAFRDELRIKIREKAVPESSFSEEEIRHYYDQHPELQRRRSMVAIRKIFVSYQAANKSEKQSLMGDLLRRITAGEDFDALARKHSEKFIENGWVNFDEEGRQMVINRRMENPFLRKTFIDMTAGEIRGVADNGEGGLYIVRCEKATDMETEFTEIKASIVSMFVQRKYSAMVQSTVSQAAIELNQAAYDAVRIN